MALGDEDTLLRAVIDRILPVAAGNRGPTNGGHNPVPTIMVLAMCVGDRVAQTL